MRAIGAILIAMIFLSVASCAGSEEPDAPSNSNARVRVAAASDLKFALEDIKAAFADGHPDIDVTLTFGSSGTFFQQLGQGAPFDVYLSADLSYPKALVDDGKAEESDLFSYAVGRLVVWAPKDSAVDVKEGLTSLASDDARKVAIANPEHAPYGKAAVAAMKKVGVYDDVKDKLVLGESVSQAAEFVQSGNADVAVMALSLALSPQFQESGAYSEVPLDDYPRIDQGGVVMGSASDAEAAREFRSFMISKEGRSILREYGFFLPGD